MPTILNIFCPNIRFSTGPTGPTGTLDLGGSLFTVINTGDSTPVNYKSELQLKSSSLDISVSSNPAAVAIESRTKVYHANLSSTSSVLDIPLKNLVYRLRGGSDFVLSLYAEKQTRVDIRRFGQWNDTFLGTPNIDNRVWDNHVFTGLLEIDNPIYNDSNEKNTFWIRQQDPQTGLWTLHEINLFSSNNGARTSVWVNQLDTDVSYSVPTP